MKNRDKYKNELMDVIKTDGRICGFVITHGVSQMFGTDMERFCGETDCPTCTTALQLWLDEEYEEPEVDWNKVPVDTLVRVRNDEDSPWVLQYFKEFDEDRSYKFLAWSNGRTSKTAGGMRTGWKYCELVEVEDE